MKESGNLINIRKHTRVQGTAQLLPASKSISNRVLILNALAGNTGNLHNLSDANDTQLMRRLVNSNDDVIDVQDAGTTMRFLTAYFTATNARRTITGTSRMKERPIGILVDALRTMGANIEYLDREGFPPLKIEGFYPKSPATIKMRGDVSSQFISAVMMIAPTLPHPLSIELTGKIGSRPYIEMTRALMKSFGVDTLFENNIIAINPARYRGTDFTVESDWSAASYWFSLISLSESGEILLPRVMLDSLQGDCVIVEIMRNLGVKAVMTNDMLRLTKIAHSSTLKWNFTDCPDLAQTVAVVCAAKGIEAEFTGLESLRIKETDRITALQAELAKIGATFEEKGSRWFLTPTKNLPTQATFETYKDHRMAMAFAPLATLMDVAIENPEVVNKSYPNFWRDLNAVGLKTTITSAH